MSTELVPAMDAETLEALRGSIEKWEGIVAGTMKDEGPANCPLCHRFNVDGDCIGCPVMARTGIAGCLKSPYEAYDDYFDRCDSEDMGIDEDVARKLAQKELDFLKSLLPAEAVTALDRLDV